MPDSSANRVFSVAPSRSAAPLRLALGYLDLLFLAVAWAPLLALGAAPAGYAAGAGAWVLQRVLAHLDRRWISAGRSPRAQLGWGLAEAFARIWLLAGAIAAAGLIGGRPDGLAAALVILGAYSVAFVVRLAAGRPAPPAPPARVPPPLPAAREAARGGAR
jgi:hypothetical protein